MTRLTRLRAYVRYADKALYANERSRNNFYSTLKIPKIDKFQKLKVTFQDLSEDQKVRTLNFFNEFAK